MLHDKVLQGNSKWLDSSLGYLFYLGKFLFYCPSHITKTGDVKKIPSEFTATQHIGRMSVNISHVCK